MYSLTIRSALCGGSLFDSQAEQIAGEKSRHHVVAVVSLISSTQQAGDPATP